jgi:hypothetical protein
MDDSIDSIDQIAEDIPIVHISDIHGYLSEVRSALRAVGEIKSFPSIVTVDETGNLHWANNDYLLVVNGDLIDRGPSNDDCMELVYRLIEEAPAGRVRYNIGNHEMAILLPSIFNWPDTYSTNLSPAKRQAFMRRILDGDITAAFEGYNYIYSHAGSNDPIDPQEVNEKLRAATRDLLEASESNLKSEVPTQNHIHERYVRLFKLGAEGGRGPSAGLCWIDFSHLEKSAPPQIVGHTMRQRAVRKGNVVCGNVLRMNEHSKGGEGVLIEEPDHLTFVYRDIDGIARTRDI